MLEPVCLSFCPSVCPSVCLSVRSLTLVNILQMSWNWYLLFMSDIAWTVLKMVYIQLMVCLQRYTKVLFYWGHIFICLKVILIDQERKTVNIIKKRVATEILEAYIISPVCNESLIPFFIYFKVVFFPSLKDNLQGIFNYCL